MFKPFTFVHAADLHLASPFTGIGELDEHIASTLREATYRAFDNLIDVCLERKARFLLVAGDVYDSAERSLHAQLKFRDGLACLSDQGILTFVIHGNHDPLDAWTAGLEWPENVHIFGPQLESVSVPQDGVARVRIHGISYPKQKVGKTFGRRFKRTGEEPFQIGLLHCNVGNDANHENYAPRTVDQLAAAKLDYWALGHVHEHRVIHETNPRVVYSGNTQGRHIREPGQRGCQVVRVSAPDDIHDEFVALDAVRWEPAEVSIEASDSEDKLLTALQDQLDRLREAVQGRPVITRITLCGRGALHRVLKRRGIIDDLTSRLREVGTAIEPFVWLESLTVRTAPVIDLDQRRQSQDFLGDMLRLVDRWRCDGKQLEQLARELEELYEHPRIRRELTAPGIDELRRLLDDAELICIDRLLDDDAA